MASFSKDENKLIREALIIRKVEEKLLSLFSKGKLNGTIHTCIGQEWTGIAITKALIKNDSIFSTHRGHGHYIAFTGDIQGLIAEMMGKVSGASKGVGGSQYLHAKNYFSNGIQGGAVPIAAGIAFAHKLRNNNNISVVFIGDGTLGEGILYETLNIISKWRLPLLVVVENNYYAQSTSSKQTISGTIKNRSKAFEITYMKSETWDWRKLIKDAMEAVNFVRHNNEPMVFEIDTYRLKAHSKGDDNRDQNEIKEFEKKDFLTQLVLTDSEETQNMLEDLQSQIDQIVVKVEKDKDCELNYSSLDINKKTNWVKLVYKRDRVVNIIYNTLKLFFEQNKKIIMMGEDIEGLYGGAFKVTKDLSQLFPGRIINTPISEAAIMGIGTGLAISGFIPIVEIMFGDFISLTFDQILQHASKFCQIYGCNIEIPLIIRTPMGGKRGYGPTHSQSLEKHFLGIPNLDIIALNIRVSPFVIYENIFKTITNPTLVIENKILYTRFLKVEEIPGFNVLFSNELFPTVKISPIDSIPDITVVCYGGLLEDVEEMIQLAFDEEEILCEVICPSLINPLNIYPIKESVTNTGKLITVEEGSNISALSSEITARLVESHVKINSIVRLGYNSIIPSSFSREMELLPNVNKILKAVKEIANE